MEKTCKYLRIKTTSLIRLFGDIPFVYKFILVALLCFVVYALISVQVDFTIESVAVCMCVFALTSFKLCSFSFSEKVLLKTIGIKILSLFFIRLVLLSIPFFLLNPYIGLVMITAGSVCTYFLSKVVADSRKAKVFRSFYRKTSYQWLSSFRSGGLWIQVVGFLLFAIALYHGNENMACVAFGWLMCVPCFMSYFGVPESRFWLVNYKNVRFLLKSKMVELLINAVFPALVCLPLAAIFLPAHLPMFMRLSVSFLFVDLLLFYCIYLCYPSKIMPFICSFIIISLWMIIIVMHPFMWIYLSIPLLLVLHVLSVQNLKSVLYVNITP